jgi:hypothetical protein
LNHDVPRHCRNRAELESFTLEALRRALAEGLMPIVDDGIVILRFTRPRAGEARLMVGVEFYPEDNEVVGKVYGAESQLKCATERRERSPRHRFLPPSRIGGEGRWRPELLTTGNRAPVCPIAGQKHVSAAVDTRSLQYPCGVDYRVPSFAPA